MGVIPVPPIENEYFIFDKFPAKLLKPSIYILSTILIVSFFNYIID
jgi:hypothetical protein